MTNMLDEALAYAEAGLPIFPCNPDKSPATAQGLKDASTDPEQIRRWWTPSPNAMIGMPTGEASGVFAIDPDVQKEADGPDGRANWQRLVDEHGNGNPVLTYTNDRRAAGSICFLP